MAQRQARLAEAERQASSTGSWFADEDEDESEAEAEEAEAPAQGGKLFREWGPAAHPAPPSASAAEEAVRRHHEALLTVLRAPHGPRDLVSLLLQPEHGDLLDLVRSALPPAGVGVPDGHAGHALAPVRELLPDEIEELAQSDFRAALARVAAFPGNSVCVDCNCPDPSWATTNLGAFLCTQCSGVHRSIGVHVSFVLSCKLDDWRPEQVRFLAEWGNDRVNERFEFHVPTDWPKPRPREPRAYRERFIRAKYEQRLFAVRAPQPALVRLAPPELPGPPLEPAGGEAHGVGSMLARTFHRTPSASSNDGDGSAEGVGMVEFVGMITVLLLEAKDLLTMNVTGTGANPACEIRIGGQCVKSSACHNTVTPTWTETHLLCWDGVDPLVINVYSDGEHMGGGQISLLPLLGDPQMDAWVPLNDRKAKASTGIGSSVRRAARGSVFLGSRSATGGVHVQLTYEAIEH